MKKVLVHGADGSDRILALVREAGRTVYVCPIDRYHDAAGGDESAVVGFPARDVSDVPAETSRTGSGVGLRAQ
jgi:hypothetical protein